MSLKQELIDKQARFWVLMAGGSTLTAACEAVGVSRKSGCRWRQATGGRIPRKRPEPSGRYLSLEERLQIADLHLGGAGVRAIAVGIGRSAATVSRELRRNGSAPTARRAGKYAPYAAQKQAELRGRRPKASKFDHLELADVVQSKLSVKWSPEQISLHLAEEFPERAEMRVCPETIYQALYVQGRGHLRADLHRHLRTGRAVRRSRGSATTKRGKIPNMILISERPAEVADRAVPGHWEGDLIVGSNCRSAIATLVERQTRYVMLVHLPDDHSATAVRDGLLATIKTLPDHLRKSLTKVPNWPSTRRSPWPRRWTSISVTPTHPGSEDLTRTRTGCCASTFPRALTFPSTHLRGCLRSRPSSTPDLARHWAASHPQKPCSVYCLTLKGPSLRRPPEFADP